MTSNVGRDLWADEKNPLGFGTALSPQEPSAKAVLDYLLRTLPSEFVNRIDDLVPFRTFHRHDLVPIAQKMMKEEEERWALRGRRRSCPRSSAVAARRSRTLRASIRPARRAGPSGPRRRSSTSPDHS